MPRFFENVRKGETFYTPNGLHLLKVKPTCACLVADNVVLHSFAPADVTLSEAEHEAINAGETTLEALLHPPAPPAPAPVSEFVPEVGEAVLSPVSRLAPDEPPAVDAPADVADAPAPAPAHTHKRKK